jgi:hypothetical protein
LPEPVLFVEQLLQTAIEKKLTKRQCTSNLFVTFLWYCYPYGKESVVRSRGVA